ncbi:MAG: hypothetical protein IPP80_12920 [Ignavibacteria bacterium]|nr:hypothetical protein [Ignavibacteria bacterium]
MTKCTLAISSAGMETDETDRAESVATPSLPATITVEQTKYPATTPIEMSPFIFTSVMCHLTL